MANVFCMSHSYQRIDGRRRPSRVTSIWSVTAGARLIFWLPVWLSAVTRPEADALGLNQAAAAKQDGTSHSAHTTQAAPGPCVGLQSMSLAQPPHVPPGSPQKLALPVVRKQFPLVLHVTGSWQLSDVAAQPPRW